MGLLDLLKGGTGVPRPQDILSPYASTESLNPIVIADWLGSDFLNSMPLSRAEAMGIPVVSKARNLLISTIAKFPLRALRGDELLPSENQPRWMYSSPADNPVTPYDRMAWTVDDLIFYGVALWYVTRGAADRSGRAAILTAEYVPHDWWNIGSDPDTGESVILLKGEAIKPENYILFNPPHEGLLNIATRTLRGAMDTEKAWTGRARNPIPLIELHRVEEGDLTADEIQAHVTAWSKARRSEDGGIGYTPNELEIRVHGTVATDLFLEGRNATRTDVGSFLNVRAAMLDGTSGVDSLTYTTRDGERNLFYELDLPYWTDPIEARLSMDDVLPSGQRARFDKYDVANTATTTGPTVED